jgi:hypothetical protein
MQPFSFCFAKTWWISMKRYCIKFCQKLGDSQVGTIQNIWTAFSDDAID